MECLLRLANLWPTEHFTRVCLLGQRSVWQGNCVVVDGVGELTVWQDYLGEFDIAIDDIFANGHPVQEVWYLSKRWVAHADAPLAKMVYSQVQTQNNKNIWTGPNAILHSGPCKSFSNP